MRELNINNGACFMKKWFQILEHEIALPIMILHALGAFKICSWTNIHHLDTRYGCISISVIERVWKGQGTLYDLSFTKADIYMIRPLHGMMTDDCGFGTCSNCRTSKSFQQWVTCTLWDEWNNYLRVTSPLPILHSRWVEYVKSINIHVQLVCRYDYIHLIYTKLYKACFRESPCPSDHAILFHHWSSRHLSLATKVPLPAPNAAVQAAVHLQFPQSARSVRNPKTAEYDSIESRFNINNQVKVAWIRTRKTSQTTKPSRKLLNCWSIWGTLARNISTWCYFLCFLKSPLCVLRILFSVISLVFNQRTLWNPISC